MARRRGPVLGDRKTFVIRATLSALLTMWLRQPERVQSTPNHSRITGTLAAKRAAIKQRRKRGRK